MSYNPGSIVLPEFGHYVSSPGGVLTDFVDGTAVAFTAQAITTGAPSATDLVFPSSGLWKVIAKLESSDNDKPISALFNVTGNAWSEQVQLPANAPTNVMTCNYAPFVFGVDLTAHPGAALTVYWSYVDAEPTAATAGLTLAIVRLGDLPVIT